MYLGGSFLKFAVLFFTGNWENWKINSQKQEIVRNADFRKNPIFVVVVIQEGKTVGAYDFL